MFDEHEPAEFELTPDLAAIERQLARMTPAAPRVDRDRLMFEAGKASRQFSDRPERPAYIAEPSRLAAKFWPAATAMMTAACVLLATMLVWQRQPTQVVVQPPAPPESTLPINTSSAQTASLAASEQDRQVSLSRITQPVNPASGYLGVRNVALARGVNAMQMLSSAAHVGNSEPADRTPPSQRNLLDELLPAS